MAEALPDVVARLTADADDFIRDWDRAARTAEKDAAEIRAAIRAAGDGVDTSHLRDLERDLRRVGEGSRAAADQLKTLQRALQEALNSGDADRVRSLEERIRALGGSARGSSDDVDDLGNSTSNLGSKVGSALGRLSGFQYVLIAIASILPAIAAAALAGAAAFGGLAIAAGVAAMGSKGLGQAFDRLAATTQGLRRHLDSLFRSQLSSEMNKLGQAISQLEPEFKGVASAIADVIKDTSQWIRSSEGMNEIKTILGGVRDLIENLRPGVKALVQGFMAFEAAAAPSLGKIGAAISYVFEQLTKVIQEAAKAGTLGQAFDAGAAAIKAFGDVVAGLMKILIEMAAQGGKPAADAISKLGQALSDAAPFIGQAFAALAMMADALATVISWIAKGIGAIKEFNDGMGSFKGQMDTVAGALGAAGEAVMKFFHDLKANVIDLEDNKIGPWIDGMVKDIQSGIGKARESVKNWAEGVNKDINQGISKAVQTVKQWWEKTDQDINAGIDKAIQAVKKFAQDVANSISQGVQKAIQVVKEWWNKTVQDVKSGVDKVVSAVKQGWDKAVQAVQQGINKAIQAVKQWFSKTVQDVKSGVDKIVQAVKEWWDKLVSAIAEGIDRAIQAVKQFVSDAVQALKEAPQKFAEAGKDMIDGLIKGFEGKAGEFLDKVKNLAQQAIDLLKGVLNIQSPSRVFADEVGAMIPAGIAEGIIGNAHRVTDAMNRVMPNTSINMAAARAAAIGQVGSAANNTAVQVELRIPGGADSASATFINNLARTGKLKLSAKAITR